MKKHRGFSLLEMMVVVGLIGVVMLGSMRMFQDAFKTQNKVEAGQDSILLTYQLAQILSDAATCTELLKGTVGSSASPIIMGKGLYVGAQLGKVKVTGLRLRDVQDLTEDVFLSKVELKGENIGGGGQFVRQLPLVFRADKQSYITECLGDNFGVVGNCKALGGKWDKKRGECDFCPALGGQSNARGRCQLAGTGNASCPMQKAFGANSINGFCGSQWDADFIGDSIKYLGTFGHMPSESITWYKRDLQKALDNPPQEKLPTKILGQRGPAGWVINIEPMDKELEKPCSALVYFTVACP